MHASSPASQLVADTLRDKHAAASHTRLSMATSTAAATTINSSASSHPASAPTSLPSPDAASSATSAPSTIAAVVPGAVRQVAWSQCGSGESYLAERVTLLLLLLPTSAWPDADAWGSEEAAAQWRALMDLTSYSIVATEVRGGGPAGWGSGGRVGPVGDGDAVVGARCGEQADVMVAREARSGCWRAVHLLPALLSKPYPLCVSIKGGFEQQA